MLPDWLLPTVQDVRAECDVRPRQLFTLVDPDAVDQDAADEAKLFALISSHIDTQAALVWGKCATASRSMPFPPTLDTLATAYPLRASATDAEKKAQGELNALTIENLKTLAQSAVKSWVIAKLWYGVSGDDAKEKATNAYINTQTLLKDIKDQIKKMRAAWLANSLELDLFY